MSTRELQQQLLDGLRRWQTQADDRATLLDGTLAQTDDPVASLLLEGLQQEGRLQRQVAQLVIDSLESEVVGLTAADAGAVREQLRAQLDLADTSLAGIGETLDALAGQDLRVQEFLVLCLRRHTERHRDLLAALDNYLAACDETS